MNIEELSIKTQEIIKVPVVTNIIGKTIANIKHAGTYTKSYTVYYFTDNSIAVYDEDLNDFLLCYGIQLINSFYNETFKESTAYPSDLTVTLREIGLIDEIKLENCLTLWKEFKMEQRKQELKTRIAKKADELKKLTEQL